MEAGQADTSNIHPCDLTGPARLGARRLNICHPFLSACEVGFPSIPILQIRKLRLKEMQSLAQSHTISKWSQTPNLFDPKAQTLNCLLHCLSVSRFEFEKDASRA